MTSLPTNPIIELMLRRRSEREGYEPGVPTRRELGAIVQVGLAAPSSKGAEPWGLHVLVRGAALTQLATAMRMRSEQAQQEYVPFDPVTGAPHTAWPSTVLESADVLAQAPAAILIENRGVFSGGQAAMAAAERTELADALFGFGLEHLGIGAALQSMWIASNSLGLSCAFLGDVAIASPHVRQHLGMSGDFLGALVVGRNAEVMRVPPRHPADPFASPLVTWHA